MTSIYQNILAISEPEAVISRRPTRLLILLTSTAGGAGQHAYMLAQHLSRDRFDITVAFGPGYPLDESFNALTDCNVVHLSTKRSISLLSNIRSMWQVYRLMSSGRFDIILTAQSIAGFIGRIVGAAVGIPNRVHCIHVYACHDEHPGWKRWVYRQIERNLDRFTTKYVAVSEATRQFGIRKGLFAPESATVIHNGVPEPVLQDGSREALRKELGLVSDSLVSVTAARFEPQKGLHLLISAMAKVVSRIPTAQLLLIGEGPLRSELEQQSQRLGLKRNIIFAGWRRDVPQILSVVDLFVLPSLWEAMPLTIVEAMAAGRAVVATDVGGVNEIVSDGLTGLLVSPRDVDGLADSMLKVLENPLLRQRFGDAGLERYRQRFTLPQMVQKFEEFLGECAEL